MFVYFWLHISFYKVLNKNVNICHVEKAIRFEEDASRIRSSMLQTISGELFRLGFFNLKDGTISWFTILKIW